MEWSSWIFEESSQSRQHNRSYEDDKLTNNRPDSVDELTASEKEEIDYVIALSLAEEDITKGNPKGREANKQHPVTARLEEDEQLARAIWESLKVHPPPRYDQANSVRTIPLPSTSRDRFCKGCSSRIVEEGQLLRSMGAVWHPDCFRCHACNLPITDKEYSIGEDNPFHKSCYREQHHPKCDVCKNFLPQSTFGVEFRTHPFWMQKYCPSHEQDGTPTCCSCRRLEPRDMLCTTLDDGRKLCLLCLNSAVMNSQESRPLYREIREFFRGLDMEVEQQIPVVLVDRQALNEAMEGEKNGHHRLPETTGISLFEEQTVPRMIQNQPVGAVSRLIEMMTGPHELVRSCDVTAILILKGLPRLLTGSILAHEMMHAWLRLAGYPKLSPEVEEGICQVMAHMWLDMEVGSSGSVTEHVPSFSSAQSSSDKQLGAFFKYQIEEDSSSVYGEGFRSGHRAVQKFSLKRSLDHIRMTGSFPL